MTAASVFASAVLISLAFLWPFASGPSASVWQLLAAWTCASLLLLAGPVKAPAPRLMAWLAVAGLSVLLSWAGDGISRLCAVAVLACIAATAWVGAGWTRASAGPLSLACGLLAAGLVSALFGLLQYYGLASSLAPWVSASEVGQAYGNLRQRNQFATLISMALMSALWLHATTGPRVHRVLLLGGALLAVALAASSSRTGLLQLLLISGMSAFLAWRERRTPSNDKAVPAPRLPAPWLLLGLVPVYVAAAWLLPRLAGSGVEGMMDRLREGAPMAHSRLVLWHNVLDLISQRPWGGWGWGELSFAHFSATYGGLRFVEILDNAHNLPLHLAVELGIPAALLICSGFGWLVLAARPWRETDPARLMAWGLLGVIMLHSLLEYPLWYGPFQLVFGLCLGFLWPSRSPGVPRRHVALARPLAALSLLVAVGYAAWDYTRISQLYLARDDRLPAWRDDTLAKVRDSWLFAHQVKFAELALTPMSGSNTAEVHALAQHLLHFSPEPRVIAKLIDSAERLGFHDEALVHAERFRVAFPREYARWRDNEPLDDPAE